MPHTPAPSSHNRLSRLIARIMDDAIRIPGTNWRIGLDPILGLIPGIGDSATAGVSMLIIANGLRQGMPKSTIARMCLNVVANTVVGSIPVAGDFFSAWFKSNRRNFNLLQAWLEATEGRPERQRKWRARDRWILAGIVLLCLLVILSVAWATVSLLLRLFSQIGA